MNVIWPNGMSLPSLSGMQVEWQQPNSSLPGGQSTTLAQYTATGKADTTFGNGGYVSSGGYFYPQYLSDGSFVESTSVNGVTSIQHFSKAGKPDTTFAGNVGQLQAPSGVSLSWVTVLKDDSFIANGTTTDGTNTPVLVHYLKTGVLDTAYGSGGVITAPA